MIGRGRGALVGTGLVAAMTLAAQGAADIKALDWPQFRGIHRDGVSAETGLLKSWSDGGPHQAWRRPIGEGFSGISVVGGRLYTMYAADKDGKATEFAAALDPATGKEIWRTAVGERYDNDFGNGPRATPTVDGDSVYVLGSKGMLMALSAKDGAERWKLDLVESLKGKVPFFGYVGSVLVDGGKVILEAGAADGKSYVGVDAKTGQVVWSIDGPQEAGYSSTLAVDIGKSHQYVNFAGPKIRALDASGKEVWSHPWPEGETHAMPVFVPPDKILASGVEGIGAAMLQIESGADGMKVKELWKNPQFRTHFNASVLHGEHLYGFDNATLKCISVKDGTLAWAKRGLGKGSLISADGVLLVLADDGRLLLVEANPKEYVEKGVVQALQGRSWTPPALSGGRIYLRNHTEIVAYDVKG